MKGVTGVGAASADVDAVAIGKVIHNDTFALRPALGPNNC